MMLLKCRSCMQPAEYFSEEEENMTDKTDTRVTGGFNVTPVNVDLDGELVDEEV